jgi:hypothetical protein
MDTLSIVCVGKAHRVVRLTTSNIGLGIDDANALINELDKMYRKLKKRKPMHLDAIESQIDILDCDTVGRLDKKLMECKKSMESVVQSRHYASVEITVHGDLHVELVIVGCDGHRIGPLRRACMSIETCICPVNDAPWENFTIDENELAEKRSILDDGNHPRRTDSSNMKMTKKTQSSNQRHHSHCDSSYDNDDDVHANTQPLQYVHHPIYIYIYILSG